MFKTKLAFPQTLFLLISDAVSERESPQDPLIPPSFITHPISTPVLTVTSSVCLISETQTLTSGPSDQTQFGPYTALTVGLSKSNHKHPATVLSYLQSIPCSAAITTLKRKKLPCHFPKILYQLPNALYINTQLS